MNTKEAMEIDFNGEMMKLLSFLFWAEEDGTYLGGVEASDAVAAVGVITGWDINKLRPIFVGD